MAFSWKTCLGSQKFVSNFLCPLVNCLDCRCRGECPRNTREYGGFDALRDSPGSPVNCNWHSRTRSHAKFLRGSPLVPSLVNCPHPQHLPSSIRTATAGSRKQRTHLAPGIQKIYVEPEYPARGQSVDASIIDFSGNGMRLRLQYPVPLGASVEIMDKNNIIHGTACHCAPQDVAYIVGVRILEYTLPPLMDDGFH